MTQDTSDDGAPAPANDHGRTPDERRRAWWRVALEIAQLVIARLLGKGR